ncbi:hypothetical protein FN846DRAFT_1020806 [Sphaerosporella brunnea]|uniref:DUF6589 domain-containing protein n=1 Tax=Sphaerosporella brunnea TaxID=1250544 RepID=A0A5J5F057_9PEZI|nr:hypothetical protein FN846DRAFT_1020806 [Sphaerosporella brunnea]
MTCRCSKITIPPGTPEPEQHILRVLEYMKQEGFTGLLPFIEATFNSQNHAVKSRVGRFYANGGFATTVKVMANHGRFGPENRVTKQSTDALKSYVGDEVIDICVRILCQELEEVTKDKTIHMRPGDLTPEVAERFDMDNCARRLQERAPYLNRVLQTLCGVAEQKAANNTEEPTPSTTTSNKERENLEFSPELWSMSESEEVYTDQGEGTLYRYTANRKRNKAMIATLMAYVIMFARSQQNNYMQTIIGFWLQSVKAPKRVIALLNRLGVSVSYGSITTAVKAVGTAAAKDLQKKVQSGCFIGICWDNLALQVGKKEETEMNRNDLELCTTAYAYELNVPKPPAGASQEDKQVYKNIREAQARNATDRKRPGIPRGLILKENPTYGSLKPFDFVLSSGGPHIQKYWTDIVYVHLADICQELFGPAMGRYKRNGQRIPKPQMPENLYTMPTKKTNMHPMRVFDLDESTIDGNARVIEAIVQELGITLPELTDGQILITGDQMTTMRIRTLLELRHYDKLEQRMRFAMPVSGWLHIAMNCADGILKTHTGRTDGQDPGSLSRFATALGRPSVTGKVTEFDALRRLILHALKGHIIAALLEMACQIERQKGSLELPATIEDLKQWIASNDWTELLRRTVEYYFVIAKPGWKRQIASDEAWKEYMVHHDHIMQKPKRQRSPDETEFVQAGFKKKWIKAEALKQRDTVNENFLIFIRDAMLFYDIDTAIRNGSTGRLLMLSELLTIWFHGNGKHRYARELLEFQVTRRALWTPEAEFLYKNNCLVNLSGKGTMPVDQAVEIINENIKVAYTPRGTMQSKEYQKVHLARCLAVLRTVREKVLQSMDVQRNGSSHTEVNAAGDIKRIAELLIKDLAMVQCIGRHQCGARGSPLEVQEVIDGFDVGVEEIMKGETLRAVLEKRPTTETAIGTQYDDVPEAAYRDFEKYLQDCTDCPEKGWFDEEELAVRMQGQEAKHIGRTEDNNGDDLLYRDWQMA